MRIIYGQELSEKYSSEYINSLISDHINDDKDEPSSKRAQKVTTILNDMIVTTRLPIFRDQTEGFRHLVVEVLDLHNSELTARFSDDNVKLWVAMESLLPSSENYLNAESLCPLLEYAQSIPAIKA